MNASITLENVSKSFRENRVIDGVSASFEGGRIYGLVGRNGSGKTVLMKLMCGFMPADEGKITVNGRAIPKSCDIPSGIGAIIEAPGFLANYSGYRNLRFLADIRSVVGKAEISAAMEKVGLDPKLRRRVGKYSLGMRQRLGLAQAIMEDPPILMLDEPMNGLDDSGVLLVRDLLMMERDRGKLIIMASHMKEDVKLLCDAAFQINAGKLIPVND